MTVFWVGFFGGALALLVSEISFAALCFCMVRPRRHYGMAEALEKDL